MVYKQTILPVVEYADQLVESGPADRVAKLQTLQDKAIRLIDNKEHPELDVDRFSNYYKITPLKERRAEHLSTIMYGFSTDEKMVEMARPEIHLRNQKKLSLGPFNVCMKST